MENLFGSVIGFDANRIIYQNLTKKASIKYLNYHVAIPDGNEIYIGEIVVIDDIMILAIR